MHVSDELPDSAKESQSRTAPTFTKALAKPLDPENKSSQPRPQARAFMQPRSFLLQRSFGFRASCPLQGRGLTCGPTFRRDGISSSPAGVPAEPSGSLPLHQASEASPGSPSACSVVRRVQLRPHKSKSRPEATAQVARKASLQFAIDAGGGTAAFRHCRNRNLSLGDAHTTSCTSLANRSSAATAARISPRLMWRRERT